jgi:hypothetical protein
MAYMAYEIEVSDDFKAWYEDLSEPEQRRARGAHADGSRTVSWLPSEHRDQEF